MSDETWGHDTVVHGRLADLYDRTIKTPHLKVESIYPESISFFDAVKIFRDGRVEVNPAYETTEAARKLWEAVRNVAPDFFSSPPSSTERREE